MEITKGNKLGRQGGSSSQEQPGMEIMKGDKGRQGGSGTTTISGFWRSATQSLRSKNPYSFQLSGEWRETNEEGRLGAAAISVISMHGDWESACRETKEGRQMKKGDFGNQHAGRQMKGDTWRRETRSGSDFGNQQPNLWEVRTPIASSYLGKNIQTCFRHILRSKFLRAIRAKLQNSLCQAAAGCIFKAVVVADSLVFVGRSSQTPWPTKPFTLLRWSCLSIWERHCPFLLGFIDFIT